MSRALFISDLHLSPGRPDLTAAFEGFLSKLPVDTQALYILGDLFDYWAGDDDLADPFNARIVALLASLAERNVALFLLPGNRDFLMGERFMTAAKAKRLAEIHLLDLRGVPTLLLHGDELCLRDAAYRNFRATVRDEDWQKSFLARPLAERKAEIEALRARSEAEKMVKDYDLMDADPAAAEDLLRTHGATRLIHGHTHRPARHAHIVAGRPCERWVLASWDDLPGGLECDAEGCRPFTA
ncbi:MAG: UDP-2,3-diacylglucosamine diphosphatase [Sulfuricellaceae bacterium]|jgi:UDP-2,3-diacylglucosamine hydrolase